MVALCPQIVRNYQIKKVDALSLAFIAQWLAGDIFNLIGCILGNQLATQTVLAVYFCFVDCILVGQFFHYSRMFKEKIVEEYAEIPANDAIGEVLTPEIRPKASASAAFSIGIVLLGMVSVSSFRQYGGNPFLGSSRTLLGCTSSSSSEPGVSQEVIGAVTSWASGLLYVGSRIPQIFKNFKRKSVEGLAIGMFMISLAANSLYGLSIILRLPTVDKSFWETSFAFIIGSIGTVGFDITLFVQYVLYRNNSRIKTVDTFDEQKQFQDQDGR